jgi:putative ABC transport system substrate-binding protein
MAYLENDAEAQKYVSVFQDALREFGWAEGRNLSMTLHWAGPELAAIEQAAKELVKWRPDVILSSSTPTTAALLRVTRTIPVVFAIVSDPIGSGFVNTFAKPGGNATGFTNLDASMGGKWLELLKEIVPDVHEVGFLFNPATASYANFYMPSFIGAGASLGIVAREAPVTNDQDIEAVLQVNLLRFQRTGLALDLRGMCTCAGEMSLKLLLARQSRGRSRHARNSRRCR